MNDFTTTAALSALGALAQSARLDIFRLLVRNGPNGLYAGEIAQALCVPQSTLSSNLSRLTQAGLIIRVREGRTIRYAARIEGMTQLVDFLLEDCCSGQPDQCGIKSERSKTGEAPQQP